jgi:hypothetical protein
MNPRGQELWSSTGELNVGAPPTGVTEMDLPLIAQIDLPIDSAGGYLMSIAIDGSHTIDVPIQVRSSAQQRPGNLMLS